MFERVVAWKQVDPTVPFHAVARAVDDRGVVLDRQAAEVGEGPEQSGAARRGTLHYREAVRAEHRRYAPFVIRRADEGCQASACVFGHDEHQGAPAFLP